MTPIFKPKEKPSILYIGGFELPDKNAAAQRVISNAKLFSKLGCKVSFIGITIKDYVNNFPAAATSGDFKYYSFSQKYPSTLKDWFSFITNIKFVKEVINKYFANDIDLIIAYDYPAISLWKLKNFCKKNKIKLVADATEWYEPQGNILFKIVKSIDTYIRMRLLLRRVDGVIAISRFLYEFYKQQNTILIPPLIDKTDKKWAKIEYPNSDVCKLIYVGSPGTGKKDRLDLIISSLARIKVKVKTFSFTIIGLTESEFLIAFPLINIPGELKECLFFKGKSPHLEAINYIKNSDYSIFLRDNNRVNSAGFPTKFVESLACGTPVLTNLTSNIDQYLVDGELGYIIDDNSIQTIDSSLVKAINQDRSHILKMKDTCFNYWGFDYRNFAKELSYFIKKL